MKDAIFIFGIRKQSLYAAEILNHLDQFDVLISLQVEAEVRCNLNSSEVKQFYHHVLTPNAARLSYYPSPVAYCEQYQQLGLKTGDARIAAFCEWMKIDILISENRHFLKSLENKPFLVMDSREFCDRYLPNF